MEKYVQRIAKAYGLRPVKIFTVQKGYRNLNHAIQLQDGKIINLIVYKREPDSIKLIKRTNAIGLHLQNLDVPVRYPIDSRILALGSSDKAYVRYAAIYNYLPGMTIPWEAYTRDHLKALGMALGHVHQTLRTYDGPLPRVARQYGDQLATMIAYFGNSGVIQAMHTKLGLVPPVEGCTRLQSLVAICDQLPTGQALHMDFVRGNILFGQQETGAPLSVGKAHISGILDFEKTAFGHPLFDIARSLAFLLVDCKYTSEDKIRKYFLYSGYANRSPTALPLVRLRTPRGSIDLLEGLVDMFLLHDFYKFLRHNPYESLLHNEHYVRTAHLLQKRGIIHSPATNGRIVKNKG